jgi:hypothetical protein
MASLEEFETEVGSWLLIEEGADTLRALVHRGNEEAEAGFTLFWPGRFDADRMMTFYKASEGAVFENRSDYRQARVVTFDRESGEEAITRAATLLNSVSEPSNEPNFRNIDFARFEHIATGRDGGERSIMVLWCVVEDGPAIFVDPDAAGLLMQPRHLPGLRRAIATLITRTSADQPALGSVVGMLEQLEEHLSPDASPIAMAA